MSTQVTLTIPDNIYQQAEYVAQTTNRPVTEVLTETIAKAFPPLDINPDRPAMEREVAAFEAMHASLWSQYPQQYVAIRGGKVIDHDADEATLVERIDSQYPETIILIRQVLPQLPRPLVFRSPRWVSQS
jgi:hypothetical protein